MKPIRWIFYLPIAIIASYLLSSVFNLGFHLIIPDWKIMKIISVTFWFSSGLITSGVWMAMGYKIAPETNQFVKWSLLVPLIILMGGSLIVNIYYGEIHTYHIPSSSINGTTGQIILNATAILTAIVFIFQPPKKF